MLPRELFENYSPEEQIKSEAKISNNELVGWKVNEIKWGKNGIEMFIDGADFPSRGYALPEAVFANNILKRMIIVGLPVVNPLRFTVLIEVFADIGWKIMSPYILKTEYLTPFSKEIYKLTKLFLEEIKINQADRIAKIVAHLFEYDNAYRLRLEDLFNETNPELLSKNPSKEIVRLLELNRQREVEHKEMVARKFRLVASTLRAIFLLPKITKAFQKAIKLVEYKNLCIDNTELYWMCHRTDYNFLNLSYEQRVKILKDNGYRLVEGQKYNV